MSGQKGDFIFQMVEETFLGITDHPNGINKDFELNYQCDRKCFLFNGLEIPANFGPFKELTEFGLTDLRIQKSDSYFNDLVLIFQVEPTSFLFTWHEQTLHLHCELAVFSQAA